MIASNINIPNKEIEVFDLNPSIFFEHNQIVMENREGATDSIVQMFQ